VADTGSFSGVSQPLKVDSIPNPADKKVIFFAGPGQWDSRDEAPPSDVGLNSWRGAEGVIEVGMETRVGS